MRFPILPAVLVTCAAAGAQVRPFGEDCRGHLSRAPDLTTSAPMVVRSTFDLEIDAVAPASPFLFILGTSNQTWSGARLPLDTASFGLPGCFLNVSPNKVFGLASDSTGRLAIPVRTDSVPAGTRLFVQVVVPSTKGELSASKGFELTVQKRVKPFTVAVLPDTQFYVSNASFTKNFEAQTQWLVDNKASRNLVFVSHVGDVVEKGASGTDKNKVQWDRAEVAMDKLDGSLPSSIVPYSVAVGNRDFDAVSVKGASTEFDKRFGPSRFTGRSWFKGAGPDGRSTYQIFEAEGQKFLHVALEWRPRDAAIGWARKILTAHAELPTILTTHQYLGLVSTFDDEGDTKQGSGDNGGTAIRHKLVEPFPQVFLVLCGHNMYGWHRSSKTILGQTVHEALVDYSLDPNGGNGWLNTLEFHPDHARILNRCVSPTYKPGTTYGPDRRNSSKNNASFPFDVHAHRRMLVATRTVRFTGGHDNGHGLYTGAQDTFISSAAKSSSFGTVGDVKVDHPGTSEQQGLLRFGGVFGSGAGQVPRDRHIARAILTLTTEGVGATSSSSSSIYRLKVAFDEKTTWTSAKDGIQIGTETATTPCATTGGLVESEGTRSFDVTSSLRAWQKGAPNHGWAIVNTGAGSWSFRSREWPAAAERPMLTVIYER